MSNGLRSPQAVTSADELRGALTALASLRSALQALWRDVGVRNPRIFEVLAEGTLDEIGRISAEVRAYFLRISAQARATRRS